jgi:hypothetical protein
MTRSAAMNYRNSIMDCHIERGNDCKKNAPARAGA